MNGPNDRGERFNPIPFREHRWYKVKVHYGRGKPLVYETYSKWHIEGNFLIIYKDDGSKTAFKIPTGTNAITEENL